MKELLRKNNNSRYGLQFISSVDLDKVSGLIFRKKFAESLFGGSADNWLDLKMKKWGPILLIHLQSYFPRVKFIDMYKIYEDL